jgi:hypothetical protein
MNTLYTSRANKLNQQVDELLEVAKLVGSHETVLPVNLSSYAVHINFSNYLGIEKPIAVLHNYEADKGYFPVKWNIMDIPRLTLKGITQSSQCVYWKENSSNKTRFIDHVLVIRGNKETTTACEAEFLGKVNGRYRLVHNGEFAQLFSLR